jgi:hypothetical protein
VPSSWRKININSFKWGRNPYNNYRSVLRKWLCNKSLIQGSNHSVNHISETKSLSNGQRVSSWGSHHLPLTALRSWQRDLNSNCNREVNRSIPWWEDSGHNLTIELLTTLAFGSSPTIAFENGSGLTWKWLRQRESRTHETEENCGENLDFHCWSRGMK